MRDRRCVYCDKKLGQDLECPDCSSEPLTDMRLASLESCLREDLTLSIKQSRYLAYHLRSLYERRSLAREAALMTAIKMAEATPAVALKLGDRSKCPHQHTRERFEPYFGWIRCCKDCGHDLNLVRASGDQSPPLTPPPPRLEPDKIDKGFPPSTPEKTSDERWPRDLGHLLWDYFFGPPE